MSLSQTAASIYVWVANKQTNKQTTTKKEQPTVQMGILAESNPKKASK